MKKPLKPAEAGPPDARDLAIAVIADVVHRRLALDDRLERLGETESFRALSEQDRGLVRAIAGSALRGLGVIRWALRQRLREGFPANSGSLEAAMIGGAAQILFLNVPDYAAVDTTIAKLRADRRADRFVPLANAVLRAIARDRAAILAADPLATNTPEWLAARWRNAYGAAAADAIARIHLLEPPLDLTVKSDAAGWSRRLGGHLLPNGTVRLAHARDVPKIDGFPDGAWWVQDVAASLPAGLLRVSPGQRVLDLCAAPGGKTAQLAHAGAEVIAVDRSAPRMRRLLANFERLGLRAETHVADALTFSSAPCDAILLDAPCSATGTIRRHPDVAWSKTLADIATLAELQRRLLDHAWTLLKPGGTLVYATCSLEPEEGERQARAFLARTGSATLDAIRPDELGGMTEMMTKEGMLRVLPCHLFEQGGADGFFAARFLKT